MIVNTAVMAQIIALCCSADGIAVYEPERPKEHRFYGKDLSNTATQPVKSSFNAKQRKRKSRKKHGKI